MTGPNRSRPSIVIPAGSMLILGISILIGALLIDTNQSDRIAFEVVAIFAINTMIVLFARGGRSITSIFP